jgi:hypothetical protein
MSRMSRCHNESLAVTFRSYAYGVTVSRRKLNQKGKRKMSEREYVRRDLMTADDVKYNVDRMRAEAKKAKTAARAKALTDHANALQAWGTARDLLDAAGPQPENTKKKNAEVFLLAALPKGEKRPQTEIEAEATANGISNATLRRAKAAAKVKSTQSQGAWWWQRE